MKKYFIFLFLFFSQLSYANGLSYHLRHAQNTLSNPLIYVIYDNYKLLDAKNVNDSHSMASLTKLMTAMVFLDNNHDSNCLAVLGDEDKDTLKNTHSKLPNNQLISCNKLLEAMLVSSDNVAAHALSRSIKGINQEEFVAMMNKKAKELGMSHTFYADPAGLSPSNISTATDLVILTQAVLKYPTIGNITANKEIVVPKNNKIIFMKNSDKLVRELGYHPLLSKTGFINESGYNLIYVQKENCDNTLHIILLGAHSSMARSSFAKEQLDKYCRKI
jgi:serine-type D-Ala-D-Ala endopeptidase (penicillin-binding protein 7)